MVNQLKPESRCLVPANSFAEYAPEPNPETGKKDVVWVAMNGERQPAAVAGTCTEFRDARRTKSKPIPGPHLVSAFQTLPHNMGIHALPTQAMPVILTTAEEC